MFKHDKQLLKTVRVDGPNPNYANLMQEQIDGPHKMVRSNYTPSFPSIEYPSCH